MIDQNGNPMPFRWFWFVQCCVHHPGILQDSERLTLAEAEHFSKYPDLVGFQIYNEAVFPTRIIMIIIRIRFRLTANGLWKRE